MERMSHKRKLHSAGDAPETDGYQDAEPPVKATKCLRERAAKYDAIAAVHATVTSCDRHTFGTANVRKVNNFVKACFIDTACRVMGKRQEGAGGLSVADIACGRGQDQSKWKFGADAAGTAVTAYFGLDLSNVDVMSACALACKYVGLTAPVHIRQQDMGRDTWECADASVDIVSCQLALHYLCDSKAHVDHFFTEAARVLRPHGLLMVPFRCEKGKGVRRHR